ncbi:MAG: hypothetical protein AMXMBFR84_20560 [Candidatus Hydrogenedentota bacterium]
MRFRQPESDKPKPLRGRYTDELTDLDAIQERGDLEATDFESLTKPAVSQQAKVKDGGPTDFATLAKGLPGAPTPYQGRTATDLLVDFFTPLMILLMVWSFLFFLLDVRYVYTEDMDFYFRWVAFSFMLGVVALNRLIARDGKDESIMYIIALGGAIAMWTLATTSMYGVGSAARGFLDRPGIALAFNMSTVVFLWWVVNRLTHECCVDSNPEAGDVGIMTGTVRKFQKAMQPKEKAGAYNPNITMEGVDPSEWTEPEKKKPKAPIGATERLSKRHPGISVFYFSVPVMIVFALGHRVIQHGGPMMLLAGNFYIGVYTVAALSLLMLTALGGLREYFRARRVRLPGGIGAFWLGLGFVMVLMVAAGAFVMPLPPMPPIAYVESHEVDMWARNDKFTLNNIVSPALAAQRVRDSMVLEYIGYFVMGVFALIVLFGVFRTIGAGIAYLSRQRHRLPPRLVHFFKWLDGIIVKYARWPELPSIERQRRVSRKVSRAFLLQNPMAANPNVSPADAIAKSYAALCTLAEDLGVPRKTDQTPYEFIGSFPKALRGLQEEAYELTELYVRSAYSQIPMDETVYDRLRKFWFAYDAVRRKVIR